MWSITNYFNTYVPNNHTYYLTVSAGDFFEESSARWSQLTVYHNVAVKMRTGTAVT